MLTPGCSSHVKNLCFVFSLLSPFSLDSSFWHGSTFGDLSGGRACDAIRQLRGAAQPCLRWVQAPRRRSATRAVSVEPLSADSAISAWVRLRRQVSLWLTGSASPVVCVDAGLGVRTVPTQRPLATAGCRGT